MNETGASRSPLADEYRLRPARNSAFGPLGTVCRLGLASRGDSGLTADAVERAIRTGVNYLNWCGYPDGMSAAIRRLGPRRRDVRIAVQLEARGRAEAQRELKQLRQELGVEYLDAVTYYYVEHQDEWQEILAPGGAAEALEAARAEGLVRAIGLTSHQRALAARCAQSGRLDFLMIRYNAAHRGAEQDVFPITRRLGMPIVAFTALRWGGLLQATPDDPPDFSPSPAGQWYRFVLCQSDVTVAVMAPDSESELGDNLEVLANWHGLDPANYAALEAHGDRVRRHVPNFP